MFDEALAAFGLQQDSADPSSPAPQDIFYLWPCNVRAFNVWQAIQTQWRISTQGREGLDWASVDVYLRTLPALRPRARAELWEGLRAMEVSALNAWAEKQKT